MQVVDASDCMSGEADDDIAFAQAAALRRRACDDIEQQQPSLQRQIVIAHQPAVQSDLLSHDADIAAPYASIADKARGNELRGIRAHDGRGVYADDLPL